MTQLQSSADFTIEDMEIGDRERRSNLTIIGTQPSDAGDYRCMAVNEPGTTAEQATLIVYGKLTKDILPILANICFWLQNVASQFDFIFLQSYPTSPSLWMMTSPTL